MLGKLFSLFEAKPDGRLGYIYVPDAQPRLMEGAAPGAVMRVEGRGPPWIVVDYDLARTVLTGWPGTLWRVKIVEAATPEDQASRGGPPLASASYTRCISVEVLETLDPAILFGEHGHGVVEVLNCAAALNVEQAQRLSSARHPAAGEAYDRAFRNWLKAANIDRSDYGSYHGTLGAGTATSAQSPINSGLGLIHNTVFNRAKAIGGPDAILHEDDGTPYLAPLWSRASQILLDAALALGAPQYLDEAGRAALIEGWERL